MKAKRRTLLVNNKVHCAVRSLPTEMGSERHIRMVIETPVENPSQLSSHRLRVCIVSSNSGYATGGLEAYTRLLARHLSAEHEVSAVARFGSEGHPGIDYAAMQAPTVLHDGAVPTRLIAPRRAFRPLLKRLHHLTNRAVLHRGAIAVFNAAYRKPLSEAMPAAVDVVHYVGIGFELLGFAALEEAHQRGAAFTVLPAVHPHTWGDGLLDIALYNQADAVLALSEYEKQHLIACGVQASRLQRIDLAPATTSVGDGERFRDEHQMEDRPLVLFIGRKTKGKGYHALCEAMPLILKAHPDACLVAIGPEGELPYPAVPPSALLDMGRVDESVKADALAACDVFCMPSATDSFGIVYVEAWAAGKPVVGGPSPAVCELISEDENGCCVSQEPAEIAQVLSALLCDRERCRRLGHAGQRLQRERFVWPTVTSTHNEIFSAVMAQRH